MRPRAVLAVVVAAVAVASAAITACGSDDTSVSPDVQASATIGESDGGPVDAISGEDICERLTIASVAADTGLDVTRATPDDTATPQCVYDYTNDAGGVSNLTVASMRSEDVGDLTGTAAFDFVVQNNESTAGDGAETQEVSAGDAAIRLSGTSLHVGVVQLGDRVVTLVVPADDVNSDGVDSLIATMATTLD